MEYIILLKVIFSFIILASCLTIYVKTNKLYKLSSHKGIKYFRDSFLFFGLAFIANVAIVILNKYYPETILAIIPSYLVFNFALTMGGLLLVYCLIWKEMEADWEYVILVLAVVLSFVDYFYLKGIIYAAQIFTLGYGMILSYSSYQSSKSHNFRQLFFISIVLAFIGYGINLLSIFLIPIFPAFWLLDYAITASAFIIITYSVVRS
jgi:hypothetical protein